MYSALSEKNSSEAKPVWIESQHSMFSLKTGSQPWSLLYALMIFLFGDYRRIYLKTDLSQNKTKAAKKISDQMIDADAHEN